MRPWSSCRSPGSSQSSELWSLSPHIACMRCMFPCFWFYSYAPLPWLQMETRQIQRACQGCRTPGWNGCRASVTSSPGALVVAWLSHPEVDEGFRPCELQGLSSQCPQTMGGSSHRWPTHSACPIALRAFFPANGPADPAFTAVLMFVSSTTHLK